MKKNAAIGVIQLIGMMIIIIVVVALAIYYTRMKYKELKLETIRTDMLQIQWKVKDYIDEQTVRKEDKTYLGKKISELKENDIIKEFLSKNIISEELYEKYYVLTDNDLTAIDSGITNYEGSYFLINYDDYEVIITKGFERTKNDIIYTLNDINEKIEEE